MSKPVIDKIMVGKPQTFGNKDTKHPMGREWTTGIVKNSVEGDIWVGKTHLEGDGQADFKRHGGPEKAIFVYTVSHYDYWITKARFFRRCIWRKLSC
ncbi:hypothetical protein [Gracilibacillus saliphilus]|uniref:hypothetical protein n=1 Tax=Gracilibacillus saliphilus TaxID=543890 RepID=UPI0013D19279|nr:hypothetical protein [Gracilibacillus saliphilus]